MTYVVTRARLSGAIIAASVALACSHGDEPDAYGNFETDETVVSAEVGGRLMNFAATEGAHLATGQVVAVIDTVQLALQRDELSAQRAAVSAHIAEVSAQGAALELQRDIAQRAYDRTRRLWADSAATTQQLDQATQQLGVLREQIQANARQRAAAADETRSATARIGQAAERLSKAQVTNVTPGTVLATYVETAELVQPGTPLYKVAPLDTMTLRAYVSDAQLAQVRIGSPVQIAYDIARDRRAAATGVVTWVSSQAEFTPTPIQTRDERASQVYAVKVRVPNPSGAIKVGMPGEIRFDAAPAAAGPGPSQTRK